MAKENMGDRARDNEPRSPVEVMQGANTRAAPLGTGAFRAPAAEAATSRGAWAVAVRGASLLGVAAACSGPEHASSRHLTAATRGIAKSFADLGVRR